MRRKRPLVGFGKVIVAVSLALEFAMNDYVRRKCHEQKEGIFLRIKATNICKNKKQKK